jgi:hypothetical protein
MEYLAFSLIKIIVTIGLLLVSAIILLRYYLTHKKQPLPMLPQNEDQKIILPLRLQACERLVLYLDRIAINNLIARINKPEMNAHQLQAAMVSSVREEFEYNLSQQLYISTKSWELIKNAKEETIRIINTASMNVAENATSSEMVRILLDQILKKESSAVDIALEEVKKEIQGYWDGKRNSEMAR